MKKNFFATLIIVVLTLIMSFTLTSCDLFNRGNGSGSEDGSHSNGGKVSPENLDNAGKAALLDAIAQSIYKQENFVYDETAPQNAPIESGEKIDEERTEYIGLAKHYYICLAAVLELTADLYSDTDTAIENNKILKFFTDFNGTGSKDVGMLMMPVFKSGNVISIEMGVSGLGEADGYMYMEVEYDPETSEAVAYVYNEGVYCFSKSDGDYFYSSADKIGEEYNRLKQEFEDKLADEANIMMLDSDFQSSVNRFRAITYKSAQENFYGGFVG